MAGSRHVRAEREARQCICQEAVSILTTLTAGTVMTNEADPRVVFASLFMSLGGT